jgi:hypothetical protein
LPKKHADHSADFVSVRLKVLNGLFSDGIDMACFPISKNSKEGVCACIGMPIGMMEHHLIDFITISCQFVLFGQNMSQIVGINRLVHVQIIDGQIHPLGVLHKTSFLEF